MDLIEEGLIELEGLILRGIGKGAKRASERARFGVEGQFCEDLFMRGGEVLAEDKERFVEFFFSGVEEFFPVGMVEVWNIF